MRWWRRHLERAAEAENRRACDRTRRVEDILKIERDLLATVGSDVLEIETGNTAIPGTRVYRRENETAPWVMESTNGGER